MENEIVATLELKGRSYEIFRVGLDSESWQWGVIGIRPLHTTSELAVSDSRRPHLPHAYGWPLRPSQGWVGAVAAYGATAPISDGWEIRDEMNRYTLAYAATLDEIGRVAAEALGL